MKTIELSTTKKHEIINITSEVGGIVSESKVKDGICVIQSLHTTAGLYCNVTEDLQGDVIDLLEKLAPESGSYRHNSVDPNAEAHLKKILTGRTVTMIVEGGRLVLGTWEKIQFAEFDGPRRRTVAVKVIG